jgi:hypothetical protein
MPLQSLLFRGDPKLEACLLHDSAHVTQGAFGVHVGKIQRALIVLDAATIGAAELASNTYGASTAASVLSFKTKRDIVNRAYQSQADNIVGKMTIAALDREMLVAEQTIEAVFEAFAPVVEGARVLLQAFQPDLLPDNLQIQTAVDSLSSALTDYTGQPVEARRDVRFSFLRSTARHGLFDAFPQLGVVSGGGSATVAGEVVSEGSIEGLLAETGLLFLVLLAIVVLGEDRHRTFLKLQERALREAAQQTVSATAIRSKKDAERALAQVRDQVVPAVEQCKKKDPVQLGICIAKGLIKAFEDAVGPYRAALTDLLTVLNRITSSGVPAPQEVQFKRQKVRDTRKTYDDALRDLAKCLQCDNIKFDD